MFSYRIFLSWVRLTTLAPFLKLRPFTHTASIYEANNKTCEPLLFLRPLC
jgi:hypothetical protein